MKIVIAMDSFKGSINSFDAGLAVKEGIQSILNAQIEILSIGDGGEGTIDALFSEMNGVKKYKIVSNPNHQPVKASYAVIENKSLAIMEMSKTSGLNLIDENLRNPMNLSTYGFGELIRDAINLGIRNFIIGIGGSATNDGGAGMLQALGYKFLDKNDKELKPIPLELKNLAKINDDDIIKELKDCTFNIACDVVNPLLGENGASYIYAPQKGADKVMIKELDSILSNYADISYELTKKDFKNFPGCGAAGGLGFAFKTFLNSNLESGIELVLNTINFNEKIKNADFIISGEGKIDSQSFMGKTISGILKRCKQNKIPLILIGGSISNDVLNANIDGIYGMFSIIQSPISLIESMKEKTAYENISLTSKQIFNLIGGIYVNN